MEILTRDFGLVDIDEQSIYHFPEGVYGFEEAGSFAVFMQQEDDVSFVYLQATEKQELCFLVFSPWDLFSDYEPRLAPGDLESLDVNSEKDLIFLTIATVPASIQHLSINIKSPIVLNPNTMQGRQIIVTNPDYPVKYFPFLPDTTQPQPPEHEEDASC